MRRSSRTGARVDTPGATVKPRRRGHPIRSVGPITTGERRKETLMGLGDDIKHNAESAKGSAKEGLGKATGNDEMVAEGKADKTKADAKKVGQDVKDAVTGE
ncbi:hypothetical protein GCM10009532_00910 [Microbacterium aurantiacum]